MDNSMMYTNLFNVKNNKIMNSLFILTIFFVYMKTIPASLYAGDPGELITAGYTLGIAHPSGYPLYVLLGKIFTLIPIGNIAFRINLMTMIFTFLGLLLFYISLNEYFKSKIISVFCTFLLAFSPTLWNQSLVGEVYSLNFLFFVTLVYLELTKPDSILIYYIYGLSISNHQTMCLLFPLFLVKTWQQKQFKNSYIYLLFILGLTPYLYLYLRAQQIPMFNWGNPSTLKSFIFHITRGEYTSAFKNPFSFFSFFKNIWYYITALSKQFIPFYSNMSEYTALKFFISIFVVLIISFAMSVLQRKKYLFLAGFLLIGLCITFLINPISNRELFDVEVFYIPSYVIFCFFLGGIISWSFNKINFNTENQSLTNIISSILVIFFCLQLFNNIKEQNMSHNFFAYNYGRNLLKTIRKNGLIFAEKDNIASSLSYLLLVENRRKDVVFYNSALQIVRNLYPSTLNENKIYIKNKITYGKIPVYRANLSKNLEKDGILYSNYPRQNINKFYNLYKVYNPYANLQDFDTRNVIIDELFSEAEFLSSVNKIIRSEKVMKLISEVGKDKMDAHIKLAVMYELNKKFYKALDEYNYALKFDPNSPEMYNNIGFVYHELGNYMLAEENHKKALSFDSTFANAYYGLAQLEEKSGKMSQATENWKKYLKYEKERTVWNLEAQRHIGHIKKSLIK